MKPIFSLAVVAVGALCIASTLAACHPPRAHHGDGAWNSRALKVPATLDCPDRSGRLSRIATAADGQSCEYKGPEGDRVTLTRLALDDQTPQAALAPTEASLRTLVPPRQPAAPASSAAPSADDRDAANINLPGVHVHAQGDKAEVNVFGITVKADGQNANVNVGGGSDSTVVLADANGAEIRATGVGRTNVHLVFVLASNKPGATGLRAVGYLASGPRMGPIVVATFKSTGEHNDWRGDADVNALVRRNAKS